MIKSLPYVQIVIAIKDLKNSRDLKNWEMLKTNIVKKGNPFTMVLKKTQTF